MATKKCITCKLDKPFSAFRRSGNTLRSGCVDCERIQKAAYRKRPEVKAARAAYQETYTGAKTVVTVEKKMCTKCGRTKAAAEFGKNKLTRDQLASWCRQCIAERMAENRRQKSEAS